MFSKACLLYTSGTYNTPYRFDSYVKGVTPIDFIPCDYRIDEAGVKKQLLQAICAMEPCTITAGLTCYRWGAPFDISLTHVEVDLDKMCIRDRYASVRSDFLLFYQIWRPNSSFFFRFRLLHSPRRERMIVAQKMIVKRVSFYEQRQT